MEEVKIRPLSTERGLVSLDTIERIVVKTGRLDIRRVSRKREYVLHRGIFFMLAVAYTDHSLATIGEHLDKDHATVIHANKTTPWTLAQFKESRLLFDKMHSRVRAIIDKILDDKMHTHRNLLFDPTDYKNVYDRVDLLMRDLYVYKVEIQELRTELAKDKTVEYDTAI
jgi:hypothetical protein